MPTLTATQEDVKISTDYPQEIKQPPRRIKAVKAEVYSRIVGYYRPVQDWNRGKKEEFGLRHNMTEAQVEHAANNPPACPFEPK